MRLPPTRTVLGVLVAAQTVAIGLVLGVAHPGTTAAAAPSRLAVPVPASSSVPSTVTATPTPTSTPLPGVAPLGARVQADVLVVTTAGLTRAQVDGLLHAVGATRALQVDAGHVRLGRGSTTALGVDPSTFRPWTPQGTAESTPLWQSVAAGRVAVAHAVAKALAVPLGGTETVGTSTQTVGAYATTGLPGVGVVLDRQQSHAAGLISGAGLVIGAAGRDPVLTAALAQRFLTQQHLAGTAAATRVPTSAGHLQWVAPAYGPITSPFGPRSDPNHPGHVEVHEGIDIGAPLGAPIYAAADGVVQYAGPAQGYGQEVIVSHAGGVSTVYGHMELILVTSGPVKAGQPIALVGAEGDATGPHLHFGVYVGGVPTDPAAWLTAHGVTVTR